jgi:hypothetical protein
MGRLPNPRPRLTAYLHEQERKGKVRPVPNVTVGVVQDATTPGAVIGKAEITDQDGTPLGWIAIYSTIT